MLWALAALALILQGALSTILPAFFCPDLVLVTVLCIGMQWEGFASGSAFAAFLGFAADLLSGALMGQHALLFLLVFATGQVAARQLNLRSALSLMMAGASVVFIGGVFLVGLSGAWRDGAATFAAWGPDLLLRAGVSALITPTLFVAVRALSAQLLDEDAGPRSQRLSRPGRVP